MGCTAALTGCHGSEGMQSFAVPEEFDLSREYEVTFWAKNDTNKNQTAIYEKAIADFENLYPNITVNLRLYTDYGKIYNDVITNIATNTTPNVCITYPDHIATYLTGGNLVVPLDELFVDERYGLGGSEVRFDAPRKSSPRFWRSVLLADIIMRCLICVPRKPAMSTKLMWRQWGIRCRKR
jgi:multiple sugar transport system substrate-binding protein